MGRHHSYVQLSYQSRVLRQRVFGTDQQFPKTATRAIFQAYASIINVNFVEMSETATQHADLRLAESDSPTTLASPSRSLR
jgi:hypothetical protein